MEIKGRLSVSQNRKPFPIANVKVLSKAKPGTHARKQAQTHVTLKKVKIGKYIDMLIKCVKLVNF